MEGERKPHFSGWATRAGIRCADGRTIMPDAFKHHNGQTVPLVWQHNHNSPENVLGHALLEAREDGLYCYGFFNDTPQAEIAKTLVQHEDIQSLSIFANQLTEKAKQVFHGVLREVSLVLSGANPGAYIDNIAIQHDGGEIAVLDDEAIIYTGLALQHGNDEEDDALEHAEDDDPTIQDVYDAMSDEEKKVVQYMVGAALEQSAQHSGSDDEVLPVELDVDAALSHAGDDKEGKRMTRNVFEQQGEGGGTPAKHELSHDALRGIVVDAERRGSLRSAVEAYALQHGIENLEVLFPDAQTVQDSPEFNARRVEWVAGVLNGTRHSPFTRIKSIVADITFDEARAKGYIKGTLKKEEWFGLTTRSTTPTTVYKKQKLDRDDIIDITTLDVVAWLKAEMRLMLDEEIARAVLIGDGRAIDDEDKIKDPLGATEGAGIRSIAHEHDLYAATVTVPTDATSLEQVDAVVDAMGFYKGSGSPTLYTTRPWLNSLLLTRNATTGQRYWRTKAELASEMGVSNIVEVEAMEGQEDDLLGIIVNLKDYTVGTDKGGDVAFFDDFDIDYNQYKYLIETRMSGALTKIRSAIVLRRAGAGDTLRVPVEPTFDGTTLTVATTTGVTYKNKTTGATLTTGAPVALDPNETVIVEATPNAGSYFENNVQDEWTFKNTA